MRNSNHLYFMGDTEEAVQFYRSVFADTQVPMERTWLVGNNFSICIHAECEEKTRQLFHQLAAEGKIEIPLNKTFWGAWFGICVDRFGVQWMINYACNKEPS